MFYGGKTIKASGTEMFSTRLDLPPPPAARLPLPAEFGRRFAIFADAEEEFDWSAPLARTGWSTDAISQLPQANRFFTDRGCRPTYMVDWAVAAMPDSAAVMRRMADDAACDIGTQLHPWLNPPFDETLTPQNSYAGNLDPSLEAEKLRQLTGLIQTQIGTRPVIYRAGRYGVGRSTAAILAEQGYRLDVSARALFDYSSAGGPDFREHPVWPWRVLPGLAALPLTAGYTGMLRRYGGAPRSGAARGALARLRLLDRVPLTPEGVPLCEALEVIERLLEDGQQLFSLSFHTPSVVPGHTPYVRDTSDLEKFWSWWDGVFDLFARHGVLPVTSGEIVAALHSA